MWLCASCDDRFGTAPALGRERMQPRCLKTASVAWNDAGKPLWARCAAKGRVVPAHHCVLHAPKIRVARCASPSLPDSSSITTVNAMVNDTVNCMFLTPFTRKVQKTRIKCGDSGCGRREGFAIVWQFCALSQKPLRRTIDVRVERTAPLFLVRSERLWLYPVLFAQLATPVILRVDTFE